MKIMKNSRGAILALGLLISLGTAAQVQQGHTNQNKFRQLYDQFADPNKYHNASGAPGVEYYQQKVDYVMDIELDDQNSKLYGMETITYTNNSPDQLPYLWLQLDQNIRKKDAPALEKNSSAKSVTQRPSSFVSNHMEENFDGGFNIDWVRNAQGKPLPFKINQTMMRIDLPKALAPGEVFKFNIKWWYNINNHVKGRGRSGYELLKKTEIRPM